MDGGAGHGPCPRRPLPSNDAGQDRALASDSQEPHPARELLSAWRSRSADRGLRRNLQSPALPREPRQPDTSRRLLRARSGHPHRTRKDQAKDHPTQTLAAPSAGRITSKPEEPALPSFRSLAVSKILPTDTVDSIVAANGGATSAKTGD